jgi:hypothetical protein
MIDIDYHIGGAVGSAKATATQSRGKAETERPSLDPAVTALLDHIAEDLAREYVRLMERAADAGSHERLPSADGDQEATHASRDLRPLQLGEPAPREH